MAEFFHVPKWNNVLENMPDVGDSKPQLASINLDNSPANLNPIIPYYNWIKSKEKSDIDSNRCKSGLKVKSFYQKFQKIFLPPIVFKNIK